MMKKEVIRHHFPLVDSTNHWLKEHNDLIPNDQIVLVTAEEQIAGRGRQGHLWNSPKGVNLYASFGLLWKQPVTRLPLVTAVAVCKVLENYGFFPRLKWPNDILLNGKKVAGILCEAVNERVIIGLGLNINMDQSQLDLIDQPATSLMVERGEEFDIDAITQEITTELTTLLNSNVAEDYQQRLSHKKGDTITFHDNGLQQKGTFNGLTSEGFLKLTLPTGEERTYGSGNIQ